MKCPHCKQPIPDEDALIALGQAALGRRGKGAKKARSSEQCRRAGKRRWEKQAEAERTLEPVWPAPTEAIH